MEIILMVQYCLPVPTVTLTVPLVTRVVTAPVASTLYKSQKTAAVENDILAGKVTFVMR